MPFIVSDELEAEDLKRIFPKNSSVIVPDFLPPYQKPINQSDKTNKFNLVFISHLRESKNLMFVLKLLKKLPEDFYLTVYGNADDSSYFNKCMNFINQNEMKHRIHLKGLISHDKIIDTFADHNFFIFPTKTENFGYVILESMLGGCIPVISKHTPWSEMDHFPGLSLDLDLQAWSNNLLELVDNPKKIKEIQSRCKNFANNFVATSTSKDKFLAHIYDR
jgi:glycosyltransferase involved in cell wall biosynthesis